MFCCNILRSLEGRNQILVKDSINHYTNLEGCEDFDPSEEASKKDVTISLKDVNTFLSP